MQFQDSRDEDEKQWVSQQRSHSEDNYWTDENSDEAPEISLSGGRRKGVSRASAASHSWHGYNPHDLEKSSRHPIYSGLPISESFYDEGPDAGLDDVVGPLSDEEPPAPYVDLRNGSIRRNLIQSIEKERKEAMKRHDRAISALRSRDELSSIQSQQPPASFQGHPVLSPSYTPALATPLVRDLFFINQSREGWVTADKILAEQEEDSDEDGAVHSAILKAGMSENGSNFMPNSHSEDPIHTTGLPVSISALSNIAAGRRLVRPSSVMKSIEDKLANSMPRTASDDSLHPLNSISHSLQVREEVAQLPRVPQPSVTLEKINEILETGWSRREVSTLPLSPTLFGATLTYYDTGHANATQRRGSVMFNGHEFQ